MTQQFGEDSIQLIREHRRVTRLTPLTLVPISFIYGKRYLYSEYNTYKDNILKQHIILKDPLLQKYLKMIGISNTSIPSSTMIPLGHLLALHYIYKY